MIHQNRLRIFADCLENYKHDIPLSKYLKEFYKRNKQMGSRDRRTLSSLLYTYFRLGNALPNYTYEERLMLGLLLCGPEANSLLVQFKPEWEYLVGKELSERIDFIKTLYPEFNEEDIFPLFNLVSEKINKSAFLYSHLVQPDLFLRSVKGKEKQLAEFLSKQGISFEQDASCFRLTNASKIEESTEYLYEVQDRSSQATQEYMKLMEPKLNEYFWDCCSASGGKSLLLKEMEPDVYLMCSDNRESILSNLDERFKRAGISKYKRRLIDLKAEIQSFEPETFDGIIVDAPCTGSGTWARTPERILQVDENNVKYFSDLQYAILENAIQFLKKGRTLLYITCSAFALENEKVIERLQASHRISIKEMKYIEGYGEKADTMFVALLSCEW
jgi:16S rRNA (cytosine967-C5)-methyltransferase